MLYICFMNDDRTQPASKGDLLDLKDQITETLFDLKTEILRAIYGYTETIKVQLKGSQRNAVNLAERMSVIEDRVLELEKRLNLE